MNRNTNPDYFSWINDMDEDGVKARSRKQRDLEADIYDASFPPYAAAVEMPTTMRRFQLRGEDRVLDAGAGTGRLTVELARECGEVIAVDFSFESLKVSQKRCREKGLMAVRFVQADLCQLPFRDGVFDKVGSSQVLQDLPTPEGRGQALREIRRVMKGGGFAVITTFNFPLPERLGLVGYAGKKEGYHHTGGSIYYYRFNYSEFKEFVSKYFRIEELSGIRNIPAKPFGEWLSRLGLLKLAVAVDLFLEKTPISRLTGRFLLAKLTKA